jgi:hypothetical protein
VTTTDDRLAVPATFDEYLRLHGIPADHPNLEGWREVWKRDLYAEQNAPTVIPPCPEWCRLPAGHDYLSVDGFDEDLTFERQHVAFEGKVADVLVTEHNRAGEVTVDAAELYLDVRRDGYPVEVVRALAAELVEAADVLKRLTQ